MNSRDRTLRRMAAVLAKERQGWFKQGHWAGTTGVGDSPHEPGSRADKYWKQGYQKAREEKNDAT